MSTVENWSNSSSYALASQVAAPIELGTDTEFATWSFWLFASESYHGKLFELQSGGDKVWAAQTDTGLFHLLAG
eukprot:scaffold830_cov377-Prasinococcus_capsulatus_cf.AAC.3